MCLLINANFEELFACSHCMDCKVLLIHKSYRVARSVFCDALLVLILIFLPKYESSINSIVSISVFVGN